MVRAAFKPSDFLLPQNVDMEKWSVIACDQYTSDRNYWEKVKVLVGQSLSSLHFVLPEVYLQDWNSECIQVIHDSMLSFLSSDKVKEYGNCYIYIERTLASGVVRPGVVGAVDLECYDFQQNTLSEVRPTEKTVVERIPPRKSVRDGAMMEVSHTILFCDDKEDELIGYLRANKDQMLKLYDFDLMMNAGHISGWLVNGDYAETFGNLYTEYCLRMSEMKNPQLVVGDGNHSLATAKIVYEENKSNVRGRYATVELQNIYDNSVVIHPIHRVLFDVNSENLLSYLSSRTNGDCEIPWCTKEKRGILKIGTEGEKLPVEVLQPLLDEYLVSYGGSVDYVHDEVEEVVQNSHGAIGFYLPGINKDEIFSRVSNVGVYPRKTFSVGVAEDKRFYLESRRIKE